MPFRIVDEPTFTHTIKVVEPCDGGHRESSLKVTYRVLRVDAANAFDLADPEQVRQFLHASVASLHDLVDEGGQALAYDDGVADRVFSLPYVRAALARGYFEAVSGARRGN